MAASHQRHGLSERRRLDRTEQFLHDVVVRRHTCAVAEFEAIDELALVLVAVGVVHDAVAVHCAVALAGLFSPRAKQRLALAMRHASSTSTAHQEQAHTKQQPAFILDSLVFVCTSCSSEFCLQCTYAKLTNISYYIE